LQKDISKLQNDIKNVTIEKDRMTEKNSVLNESVEVLKANLAENEAYKKLVTQKDEIINELQQGLNNLKLEIDIYKNTTQKEIKSLFEKYQEKSNEQQSTLLEKSSLDLKLKEQKIECLNLQNKVITYEKLICTSEDINTKCDYLEQTVGILTGEKAKLEKDLENAAGHIEKAENKCYDIENKLEKSIQQIKMKEEQIKVFKNVIQDLKMKLHTYVPVKGDIIDNKLAECLNKLPDSQGMTTMFIRESEGVYKFGSKRIVIKLEQDKIISNCN